MTVVINDRGDFTLENVRRVALLGEGVRFGEKGVRAMTAAYDAFQTYVDKHRGIFIYGVTSSGGPTAKIHREPEEMKALRNRGSPFIGLNFAKDDLPEPVVRAAVFATLAMFIEGTNAVHPDHAAMFAMLLDGPMPKIPEQGLIVPGEIIGRQRVAHAAGTWVQQGFEIGSANGAPFTNGMAAICALYSRRRLELAEKIFALSIEAFNAPLEAYDPALKEMWGDVHESAALDGLGRLLKGAKTKGRRFYQAPVSWRILPRVLGQAHRAVATLEEVASISMAVTASNPTFVPPNKKSPLGKTLSTGSYHNANSPHAFDSVSAAWVDLAGLAHRQLVKMHVGDVSLMPDRLLPAGGDSTNAASTYYFEWVPFGFIEEMRRLALHPSLLSPAEPAASEQDDISAPGELAYLMEARVARLFDMVLVVLAASASQAIWLMKRDIAPPLRALLGEIQAILPPVTEHRQLSIDAEKLAKAFTQAVEQGGAFGFAPYRALVRQAAE